MLTDTHWGGGGGGGGEGRVESLKDPGKRRRHGVGG